MLRAKDEKLTLVIGSRTLHCEDCIGPRKVIAAQKKLIRGLQSRLTHNLYSEFSERVLAKVPSEGYTTSYEITEAFEVSDKPNERQRVYRALQSLCHKGVIVNLTPHKARGEYRRVVL